MEVRVLLEDLFWRHVKLLRKRREGFFYLCDEEYISGIYEEDVGCEESDDEEY